MDYVFSFVVPGTSYVHTSWST